jgi:hypothetical protein
MTRGGHAPGQLIIEHVHLIQRRDNRRPKADPGLPPAIAIAETHLEATVYAFAPTAG